MDWEISPEQLKEKIVAGENFNLLDVREHWERQAAAIEPSTHIPMGDIPARVQELDPDGHIIVYCHRGVRSMNVTAWLRQQGFESVQSLQGGIDRWSRKIDSNVPIY